MKEAKKTHAGPKGGSLHGSKHGLAGSRGNIAGPSGNKKNHQADEDPPEESAAMHDDLAGLNLEQDDELLERERKAKLVNVVQRKKVENIAEVLDDIRNERKTHLSLIVVGHVDAGKSTIMGHMLVKMGKVSDRTVNKFERDAGRMGKASFKFAWVLDAGEEERNRGITVNVATTNFETDHRDVTLMDAPGHKDFVPNMISGATQADCAMLVIDGAKGGFESGFDPKGQTREHAQLVRSLGISEVVVAINKLDTVAWSEKRYESIKDILGAFLKKVGYKEDRVHYVPCSGLTGENLVDRTADELKAWYDGPTLVEAIDKLSPKAVDAQAPLVMSVTDVFKGQLGLSVAGKLMAGTMRTGDKVLVEPGYEVATARAIQFHGEPVEWAAAGDHVTVTLNNIEEEQLYAGCFIADPQRPIPITDRIRARIVTFDIEKPILKGQAIIFHHQGHDEGAHVTRLKAEIDKADGTILRDKPRRIGANVTAIVDIMLERKLCIDTASNLKRLGMFTLRSGGATVAAGLVQEVLITRKEKEKRQRRKEAALAQSSVGGSMANLNGDD
eukprot:Clim_evm100s157 gene=Clim_evmTU100s157